MGRMGCRRAGHAAPPGQPAGGRWPVNAAAGQIRWLWGFIKVLLRAPQCGEEAVGIQLSVGPAHSGGWISPSVSHTPRPPQGSLEV